MRLHATALIYFDKVRQAGSMREAARQLNVASTAVNRMILKLEGEIGTPLFDRLPQGVRLTAAGEALARHVIVTLQDFDRFRSDLDSLRGLRSGEVSIAAPEGLCSRILPDVLTRLAACAPGIRVWVERIGSAMVPEALASGKCDIGLAFDLPSDTRLSGLHQTRSAVGAVVAREHPLASRGEVSLLDCLDYPLLLPAQDITIPTLLDPVFAALEFEPRGVLHANSIELLREMARRGEGVAFQTRYGLDQGLAQGDLVHLPLVPRVESRLDVMIRAGRSMPLASNLLLDLLIQALPTDPDMPDL